MPYPLARLSYGLRCRLSELADPGERYYLQIAAGSLFICPPKLQVVEEGIDHLYFRCENSTVSVYSDMGSTIPFIASGDSLRILKGYNCLNGFDIRGLKSDIFGHFLRNAVSLKLKNCIITKQFWETLKTLFPKVTSFEIYNNDNTSHISFTDMLTAFPNVENLEITCHISKNWIEEILQCGKQTLRYLTFTFNSLELCDEFDCDRFAQRPDFNFFILDRGYPGKFGELHLAGLTQHLDLKLKRGCLPADKIGPYISILYEGDCHAWCLPLFKRYPVKNSLSVSM
uniref:F-box/LRR-repeat protein n=1 Tax=Panagrellus redivivus TaxID=6233 RepID=A0A7E4UQ75_PANRE